MIIFLSISLNICLGRSKELIETVLLSTHNVCFGRKLYLPYICWPVIPRYSLMQDIDSQTP